MNSGYSTPRHPIGYVAKRTGLSPHVLRVWERRYGAVTPAKAESRHRLYSDADIDRLKLLHALSNEGHTIGRIANLPVDELKKILRDSTEPPPERPGLNTGSSPSTRHAAQTLLARCKAAVEQLDEHALETALAEARVNLPQPVLFEKIIDPLMSWTGDGWHKGTLRVAHEHLATVAVKGLLTRLRQSPPPVPNAPLIAVATPPGELHEIGAQLAVAVAISEGWRCLYFGPNLPAPELANAAVHANAKIVALSISPSGDNPIILADIEELRQFLPDSIAIIVGGKGVIRHRDSLESIGVRCMPDLEEFRQTLKHMRD